MKRIFVCLTLLALAPVPARLAAQDPATAAAERELADERHRSLTTRLDKLEESIAAFQKNVTALRDEVRKAKDEVDRLKNKNESAATQDSIKKLAEKIEEVDKKRLADGERTVKTLEEMKKLILEKPPTAPRPGANPPPAGGTGGERVRPPAGNPGPGPSPPGGKQAGWNYKIRAGDNPTVILSALNKQGIKLTLRQLMDANEKVDWTRLQIGQVIFIPQP